MKYAASFALSAIPVLFLIKVVGYPATDFLLNTAIHQVAAIAISYCSMGIGNYLRSLELISHNKTFSPSSYLGKLCTSAFIDLGLTILWRGYNVTRNPSATHNIFEFCMEITKAGKITGNLLTAYFVIKPLISIMDKAVRILGRVVCDLAIVAANKFGFIADLRSPFVHVFKEDRPTIPVQHGERRAKHPLHTKTDHRVHRQHMATKTEHSTTDIIQHSSSVAKRQEDTLDLRHKPKLKTRKSIAAGGAEDVHLDEVVQLPHSRTIKGLRYHPIDTRTERNCSGVINSKRLKKLPQKFEDKLAGGCRMGEGVKHLTGKHYELRPTGDDRAIGSKHTGLSGPASLYPLGEAIEVYQELRAASNDQEPNVIIFDRYAPKHNAISRSM
jgi:hypothetical protein